MSPSNQSILVIGGAGYIGSHVVLELCEKGYKVTVFDNLSTGHEMNVDSRAELIQGDILNENELKDIFNNPYVAVFHFASLKAVGESMEIPGEYAKANICGTIYILNQMVESGVRNIVFSSTAAVYGIPIYLPVSMFGLWVEILRFLIAFLFFIFCNWRYNSFLYFRFIFE